MFFKKKSAQIEELADEFRETAAGIIINDAFIGLARIEPNSNGWEDKLAFLKSTNLDIRYIRGFALSYFHVCTHTALTPYTLEFRSRFLSRIFDGREKWQEQLGYSYPKLFGEMEEAHTNPESVEPTVRELTWTAMRIERAIPNMNTNDVWNMAPRIILLTARRLFGNRANSLISSPCEGAEFGSPHDIFFGHCINSVGVAEKGLSHIERIFSRYTIT